jgi:hypothetical protein
MKRKDAEAQRAKKNKKLFFAALRLCVSSFAEI